VQLGAFIPYFRNHTGVNTKSSEPWSYGEEVLEISRNYINLRYRLLPYIYSAFYEASQSGMPVMRSLAIDYTHDANIYDPRYQNQFLFGKGILVAPFESTKEFGEIYFPEGKWYSLYTDELQAGSQKKIFQLSMQQLPVFVKGGSIIPMQTLVQSTSEKPADTLFLHVYKGDTANTVVYYEDDGESYNYENGGFYKRTIRYDNQLTLEKVTGNYTSKFNNIKLVLHGFDALQQIKLNGTVKTLQISGINFLTPISRFDPQGGYTTPDICKVQTLDMKNSADRIVVEF
jgi:alpha-glucosidase